MYNLPSRRRVKNKEFGINLIPIMDAMFTLIFFMLASAKFLKLYEIGSDLPVYKLATDEVKDKKPFSLKILITDVQVQLLNSEDNKILNTVELADTSYEDKLASAISNLKAQYPSESKARIQSAPTVNYQVLVTILDKIRQNKVGDKTEKMFPEIMFVSQ